MVPLIDMDYLPLVHCLSQAALDKKGDANQFCNKEALLKHAKDSFVMTYVKYEIKPNALKHLWVQSGHVHIYTQIQHNFSRQA